MNETTAQAFLDELEDMEKEALIGSAARLIPRAGASIGRWLGRSGKSIGSWAAGQPKQFAEAGRRALHPVKSVKAGWRHMTPEAHMKYLATRAPSTAAYRNEVNKYLGKAGTHLTQGTRSSHTPGRMAEYLSRKGWTGRGKITKYLPVSSKALTAGFVGMSAPDIVRAAKQRPTPTGEGGVAERGLGELLGTGAFIAGTGGLGMLPATALYFGAHGLGSKAGRVIDRLRGGANLETAAMAPSPQQAQVMLDKLPNQSPEEQEKAISTLRKYY